MRYYTEHASKIGFRRLQQLSINLFKLIYFAAVKFASNLGRFLAKFLIFASRSVYLSLLIAATLLISSVLQSAPWPPPTTITPPFEEGEDADIAMNRAGYSVVAWDAFEDASHRLIKASTLTPGGTWTTPQSVSPFTSNLIFKPSVAVNSSKASVAMWHTEDSSGILTLFSASMPAGQTAWTFNGTVSTNAYVPDVGVDQLGNAIATWANPITNDIFAGYLPVGQTTWTSIQNISSPGALTSPNIAVTPAGRAIIVWSNSAGTVQSSILPAGSQTWGATIPIVGTLNADDPIVAIDSLGNAVAIWEVSPLHQIQASTLAAGATSWSAPHTFPTLNEPLSPSLAISPSGYAVAVWQNLLSSTTFSIESATLPLGGSWSTPVVVFSSNGQKARNPSVAVDDFGNAVTIWENELSPTHFLIQSAVLPFGQTSWAAPESIFESTTGQDPLEVQVVSSATSFEVALWEVFADGSSPESFIQASSRLEDFPPPPPPPSNQPLPPSHLSGEKSHNRFPTQTEYYNELRWDPSPTPNVTYSIWRNGKPLAKSNKTHFIDRFRRKNRSDKYSIFAIDSSGVSSTPITIIL